MVRYYCLALPLSAKRCADWGNGDGLPYWIHPSEPDPPWLRNSKSERIPKPVICVIRILPWENGPENIPGTSLHVDEMPSQRKGGTHCCTVLNFGISTVSHRNPLGLVSHFAVCYPSGREHMSLAPCEAFHCRTKYT